MNPYQSYPDQHFWSRQVSGHSPFDINYDADPKFVFDLTADKFVTAGSCFAQHFSRQLQQMGGRFVVAEAAHPLMDGLDDQGYGIYSARYGNVYTTRQLNELLQQAFELRPQINDMVKNDDGCWIDMLRPTVFKSGFSSVEEAEADRRYHLMKVREMFAHATVFVFTMGLTELWENSQHNFAYPICPGTAAGSFDPDIHVFCNQSYDDVLAHLDSAVAILQEYMPHIKVLLTVSPVMLVATAEKRGAIQSSILSKSILRAAADACRKNHAMVDYFPAYEIVTNPQARGAFFGESARDVLPEGVNCVMQHFFSSRFGLQPGVRFEENKAVDANQPRATETDDVAALFEAECDEILLDPQAPISK